MFDIALAFFMGVLLGVGLTVLAIYIALRLAVAIGPVSEIQIKP